MTKRCLGPPPPPCFTLRPPRPGAAGGAAAIRSALRRGLVQRLDDRTNRRSTGGVEQARRTLLPVVDDRRPRNITSDCVDGVGLDRRHIAHAIPPAAHHTPCRLNEVPKCANAAATNGALCDKPSAEGFATQVLSCGATSLPPRHRRGGSAFAAKGPHHRGVQGRRASRAPLGHRRISK
jgi:hypothetical protein